MNMLTFIHEQMSAAYEAGDRTAFLDWHEALLEEMDRVVQLLVECA